MVNQVKNDGGFEEDGISGHEEKWTNSGYVLEVEPWGLAVG